MKCDEQRDRFDPMKTLVCLLALATCSCPAWSASDDLYERATDPQKITLMKKGMESVRRKLVKPESAQFRKVFWSPSLKNAKGSDRDPVVCGEVRGSADDGTSGDYQRFIASGEPDGVVLEMELSRFSEGWDAYCR